MFIKKDTRKIPEILKDATSRAVAEPSSPNPADDDKNNDKNTIVTEMRFARRAPEFNPQYNVSMVIEPQYRPALNNLVQLSLYDCGLQTLAGIEQSNDRVEVLFPKLESLDLGRNPKLNNESFPDTFHTQFPSLVQLWLDDCALGPNIPSAILEISALEGVRITNNKLKGKLEDGIGIRYWRELKTLALDGNQLTSIGRGIGHLKYLEKLQIRGNALTSLPEGVPSAKNSVLTMISLSSNKLTSLPDSLMGVVTLKELFLNGNQLESLPEGLAEKLDGLAKLNLAHNLIGKNNVSAGSQSSVGDGDETMEDVNADGQLPPDFITRFGMPDWKNGQCSEEECCVVRMEGNPMAEEIKKRHLDEEKRKAKEMAMDVEE